MRIFRYLENDKIIGFVRKFSCGNCKENKSKCMFQLEKINNEILHIKEYINILKTEQLKLSEENKLCKNELTKHQIMFEIILSEQQK